MVDPGTAVGVVSLGLQVAQGLVKYYSDYKAYDDDISHAVERVQRLYDTFAALEGPLRKLELRSDPISGRVRASLNSCRRELLKLNDTVEKCSGTPALNTTSIRVREVKKKILFPFRKSTLMDVDKWVQLAQADLDTAMLVLQTHSLVDSQERASNQTAIDNGRLDLLARGQLDIMGRVDSFSDANRAFTQQTYAIVSRMDHKHEQMMMQLRRLTLAIECGRNFSPSAVSEGISLAQGLGMSHVSADHQADDEKYPGFGSRLGLRYQPRCTCMKTSRTREHGIFGKVISLYWQSHSHHETSCPLLNTTSRSDTVGARIRYCTLMFTYILESTVSCKRGAGGYSISQSLRLQRVVSHNNPAFLLLRPRGFHKFPREESFNYPPLHQVVRKLDQYFRDGTVNPADVSKGSGTLFEAACRFLALDYPWTVSVPSTDQALKLLGFLVGAGVPLINVLPSCHYMQKTPLEHFVSWPWKRNTEGSKYLCSFLLEQGFTWSPSDIYLPPPGWLYRPETLTIPVIKSGLDDDPLMAAILCKSKSDLSAILRANDDSSNASLIIDNEDLIYYMIASTGWLDGMRIMIKFLHTRCPLTRNDRWLETAYYLKQWESVDLLLQFGCRIAYETLYWLVLPACRVDEEMMQRIIEDICENMVTLRLQPEVPFPKSDDSIESYWIFHLQLPATAANTFYDRGFRHLDTEGHFLFEEEDLGYPTTPLWKFAQKVLEGNYLGLDGRYLLYSLDEQLERVRWLIDKGVRINWSHPQYGTTPAHLLTLASLYGPDPRLSHQRVSDLDGWWKVYCKMAILVCEDSCQCACSQNGCLPVISSFKYSLPRKLYKECSPPDSVFTEAYLERRWNEDVSHLVCETLEWMDTLLSTSPAMANAVLRILTFEELGITHTCHDVAITRDIVRSQNWYGKPPVPEQNIDEIHDEEEELISRLDLLCNEFEAAYASSQDPSFYNFYQGYWTNRMAELENEWDDEYVKDIEEIGIVVEPFGPELPPDFERDYD